VFSSDLPGVNPATLNEIILYYRLKTKWSGLGDSTELSRMGLSQATSPRNPNFLLWMIQENSTGKGDVQHKLKDWKP
jgi:hypothetical protein